MIDYNIIPETWQPIKLGEVCKVRNGYAFKSADFIDKGVLLFRQTNLDGVNVKLKNAVYLPEEYLEKYKDYVIVKGDILVGMSGSIGKICVYNLDKPALQNQRTGLLRFTSVVDKKFIRYYFEVLEQEFIKKSKGVAVLNISAKDIQESDLPLPPLPEQQRIVARIEEQFSSLDKGIESLKTAQQQLKVYRQAVLKWAFEGKLTNPDAKEGELPKGWQVFSIGQVVKTIDGDRGPNYPKKNDFSEMGYCLFLSTKNVREGRFVFEENIFISKEKDEILRGGKLQYNDVVITTRGTLGNVALYDEKVTFKNVRINSGMLILRVTKPHLNNYYLMKFVSSPLFSKQLKEKQSGTAQPQIPANVLREINLPIPPTFEEQVEIVAEIESRLSVCDKIEESIEESLKQAEALRQSILKKAFEGKLVPQDPNDLPASKLLERIKAEKKNTERHSGKSSQKSIYKAKVNKEIKR